MTYRGFNYLVTVNGDDFHVRHYDDLPGISIIVSPKMARQMPEAKLLVDYLVLTLESERVVFYDARVD